MFTAEDAQAKVIAAREKAELIKKQKKKAEEKQLKEAHRRAKERVDDALAKALMAVEDAAGKPLSMVRFEVGHRFGSADPCVSKLTELVMEKLKRLKYRVENTSSCAREQTETVHYKADVWRYEIAIFW